MHRVEKWGSFGEVQLPVTVADRLDTLYETVLWEDQELLCHGVASYVVRRDTCREIVHNILLRVHRQAVYLRCLEEQQVAGVEDEEAALEVVVLVAVDRADLRLVDVSLC